MKPAAARSGNDAIGRLREQRPRSRFLRASLLAFALLLLLPWFFGGFRPAEAVSGRRLDNLERFVEMVRPEPLVGRPFDAAVALEWARRLFAERGLAAALATLAIAVLAIAFATAAGLLLAPLAARNFAAPEPFAAAARPPSLLRRLAWRLLTGTTRLVLILLRSLPEYVLAFLLLAMLGPSAWPAVLALAVHNAGIQGRLYAETIENHPERNLAALRSLGASRTQIGVAALLPGVLSRFVLFTFYRFESCVRESTVLGMLGVVSLGYWIADTRSRGQYDQFLLLILLASLLVLAADFASALVRAVVRRAP